MNPIPNKTSVTVPPIPAPTPLLIGEFNETLRALGLPLNDEFRARVYWALKALNHHGWGQQHALQFIRTGQLPDPQELAPLRVVLVDRKTVQVAPSNDIMATNRDSLPHFGVRLLYGKRFTHVAVCFAAWPSFRRRMARWLGSDVVEHLCSRSVELMYGDNFYIDQWNTLVFPMSVTRDRVTGMRYLSFQTITCGPAKTAESRRPYKKARDLLIGEPVAHE